MKRVLVIDDELQIRRLLKISLEKKDYHVFEAASALEGLQEVQSVRPDIILLDLNLPDKDGLSVLREIREWSSIPIVILSVRNSEEDIVSLLNAGADDYLVKPFNTGELLARMNVALRHQLPDSKDTMFRTGELLIDFSNRIVKVGESEIKLTPTEYSLLSFLARNCGKIVTQDQILRELWGPLAQVESGNLRVHILSLRKKIENNYSHPELLVTEPGIGYRLIMKN
ncbi:MAG: Two component transcriptional regulator, winged helix family [uncultured bacterium]|nr:MAG: Two component transcriptional regulator, winged helix family [uncultured bacterium]